jgi:signal transduction histidine kinase
VARTFHVYEPDGTVSKICGVAYDVSIKKEAEKRVNEFYSVISHELRTPLTSIRGALGLIQGGVVGWGTDMSKEMVNVAIESSDRLIRLINDILDIKKIEAGQIKLSRVAVDCTTPMKAAKEVLDGMAKHVGCEVTYKPADKLTVIGDEDKLTQVLVNLVSNAIKFSGEGKHVSIYADRTEQNSVRFSVQDDGPGISQKDQSRLFKKFQQLDSSDTRGQGGTGLGLAIAKAMVEHHGGIIGVDSELGKGSTFWFEIPADS